MDDSLLDVLGVLAVLVAVVLVTLYWDRIRSWQAHRAEIAKQRRNREGRA
jgi:hypothetical protein